MEDHIAKQLAEAFGEGKTVYQILQVERNATTEQIKKAYKKLALQYHPDKGGDADKFKAISVAHSILADDDKRKEYDETGNVDGEEMSQDYNFWYNYFRDMFPRLTITAIEDYSDNYKGSTEEENDVIEAYRKTKGGNVNKIMQLVMLAEKGDEGRICSIIDNAIKADKIKPLPSYIKSRDKVLSESSSTATKKRKKSNSSSSEEDLAKLMLSRRAQTSSEGLAINSIMSKYGIKSRELVEDDISDEAFEAAQARTLKKKKESNKGK